MVIKMAKLFSRVISILILVSILCVESFPDEQVITTIKTEKGQIFDCVNFYKQPAFKHPLITNLAHKLRNSRSPSHGDKSRGLGFEGIGCPFRTVPIARNTANKQSSGETKPNDKDRQKHCVAVVQTRATSEPKQFFGAYGAVSLYKAQAEGKEWTTSRIKLKSDQDSIEAGWMVNPDLFKDGEARLYAKFSADGKGCVNTDCPGFVQVFKDIPLGFIPKGYSKVKGDIYVWNVTINKHQDDKHWWISLKGDSATYDIGYYPETLFNGLRDHATQIEWGGEVDNPELGFSPQMGSGIQAVYDTSLAGFFTDISVVDHGFNNVEPQDTEKNYDCPELYTVLDFGSLRSQLWPGRTIVFGGPESE